MTGVSATRAAIIEKLRHAQQIVVISHYNPDADAYGSSLALTRSLRALGKDVTIVNESGVLKRYQILPDIGSVKKELPTDAALLVACDCGSLQRIGDSLLPSARSAKEIINIDHHISNDNFGKINFVDTTASSTSEIMYFLLIEAGFPIDKETAECLLAGIMGDTGSFRYSCTSATTFSVAAALAEKGASSTKLFEKLYGSPSLGAVKLQAECMLKIELDFENRFAYSVVSEALVTKHNATIDDTEGLAERIRDIEGVKISASIRQDGSVWRVSLRSVSPEFNVSNVAASFGGGGHVQAAAFRSSKPLDTVISNLKKKVSEVFS